VQKKSSCAFARAQGERGGRASAHPGIRKQAAEGERGGPVESKRMEKKRGGSYEFWKIVFQRMSTQEGGGRAEKGRKDHFPAEARGKEKIFTQQGKDDVFRDPEERARGKRKKRIGARKGGSMCDRREESAGREKKKKERVDFIEGENRGSINQRVSFLVDREPRKGEGERSTFISPRSMKEKRKPPAIVAREKGAENSQQARERGKEAEQEKPEEKA